MFPQAVLAWAGMKCAFGALSHSVLSTILRPIVMTQFLFVAAQTKALTGREKKKKKNGGGVVVVSGRPEAGENGPQRHGELTHRGDGFWWRGLPTFTFGNHRGETGKWANPAASTKAG